MSKKVRGREVVGTEPGGGDTSTCSIIFTSSMFGQAITEIILDLVLIQRVIILPHMYIHK